MGPGLAFALLALIGTLTFPSGVWAQEELFVTNNTGNSITVYARTANGDAPPTADPGWTGHGVECPCRRSRGPGK